MYRRFLHARVAAALADTRVVLLQGARQTGKSTLAQEIVAQRGGQYVTLDDAATVGLARNDPGALLDGAGDFLVIDEVQQAPQLFPALKQIVDRDRRPGRFLLTGSANALLLPKLAESLAGRMEILPLDPLSQGELAGFEASLVDALFAREPFRLGSIATDRADVCERIVAGGFPEALARPAGARRDAWFRSYVTSLLQRDVRDLAHVDGLTDMPRLLSLLAARSSSLMNASEVSRSAGLPLTTLRRYLALFEATFLLQPLPAWSTNLSKRLVKAPKVHLLDAGLAAHLRGESEAGALVRSPTLGPLLETFVVQEIRKQLAWSRTAATAYHLRTASGREVDLVLESPGQRVAGVEIKASATVTPSDFDGLRTLKQAASRKFARGVVLYLGAECLPFGEDLWAVPVATLWSAR